jgi:ABC-type transporter MlaC component
MLSVRFAYSANTNEVVETPEHFISTMSEGLQLALTEAKKNKRLDDVDYIDALIDKEVIPHVQLDALCKRIFKQYWNEIVEKGKKQEAINAVLSSLKRTYRLAVSAYNGQQIDIIKSNNQKNYSIVRIKINTNGKNDHIIDFAVRKFDSQYKVFDFSIDGIGVSKTLSSSIGHQIQSIGLEATLDELNHKTPSDGES